MHLQIKKIFKEGEDYPHHFRDDCNEQDDSLIEKSNYDLNLPLQNLDADEEDICDDKATIAAQKAFHIKYLFPWQKIVIANILDSVQEIEQNCCINDVQKINKNHFDELNLEQTDDIFYKGRQIVLLPTGAGKSLCFLTPALLINGPTLILYPLLALMSDQKRRMDEGGLESVVFRGQQTLEEREENFSKIKNGAKIILANPEVLQNEVLVMRLKQIGIMHIAIDEAHCVSEWGDSFRPAYLTLGGIIKMLGVKTVTAFTATASPTVLSRIAEVLFDGEAHIVRSDSDRPNIHYSVINTYAKKRMALKLAVREQKPIIIFCGTRKRAENMARELDAYYGNDLVKFYHAGLSKEEKTAVEKWFYPKSNAILCCTCAFGMGVDKKDIHCVIHLDPPATAEAYIQEAGRGGRDGSVAKGILLWSYNDSVKTNQFLEGSREHVLKDFAESNTCRRQVLLDALGGEKAFCDGCDVCERNGPAPFAEDAFFVLSYISNHRKQYDRETLCAKLGNLLNLRDNKEFNMNIWDHSDVAEIISQLEREMYIRKCLWPWRKKYTCGIIKQNKVSKIYSSDRYKKLVILEQKIFKTKLTIIECLKSPYYFILHLLQNLRHFLVQMIFVLLLFEQ